MRKLLFVAVLAALAMLSAGQSAQAAFQMRITSSGGASVTITDNDAAVGVGEAPDFGAPSGQIVFIGDVGGFHLQVNTGLSKPILGSAAFPEMDLNYVVVKNTSGVETLTIEISDQDFTTSPVPVNLAFGGTTGAGQTTQVVGGTGLNNALYNTSDASATSGPFGAGAYSGTSGFEIPLDNVAPAGYSLTLRVILNSDGTNPSPSSGDVHLTAAPAPAGLLLLAAGTPVLGLAYLRRRKVTVKA
jgi:hypothetical protein